MELIDLAKELNKRLMDTKEYKELKKDEENFYRDLESVKIYKDFINLMNLLRDEKIDYDDSLLIRQKISLLYDKIENNDILNELRDALQRFVELKAKIFATIEKDITYPKNILMTENKMGCNRCCRCNKIR